MAPYHEQKKKALTGQVQDDKKSNRSVSIKTAKNYKEVKAFIIFAVCIFVLLSFFGATGAVGRIVCTLLYGLVGRVVSYLLLGMSFYLSWCILRGTEREVFSLKNIILFSAFLVVISSLMHTLIYSRGDYQGLGFFKTAARFWQHNAGGGLVGGFISFLLQGLLDKVGTFVILIPGAIVLAMILFSWSLVSFLLKCKVLIMVVYGWISKMIHRFRKAKEKQRLQSATGDGIVRSKGKKDKVVYTVVETTGDTTETEEVEEVIEEVIEDDDTEIIPGDIPKDDEYEDINFISHDMRSRKKSVFNTVQKQNSEDGALFDLTNQMNQNDSKTKKVKKEIPEVISSKLDFNYIKPPFSILESVEESISPEEQKTYATKVARKLEEVMRSFGIEARVINIARGPAITRYELQPHSGVKVSRIKNLSDDIALNLAAPGIRIEAPIPGKAAIGIEIPNKTNRTVYLKDLIESEEFITAKSKLSVCLGEDISGVPIISDLSKMTHLLIAGSTGSGKSVCVNCLINSLLFKASPSDVRFIMIDPKVVELSIYNGIPHLLIPVVTEAKLAASSLAWAVQEMENRYKLFAMHNLRDINSYNAHVSKTSGEKLPRIVIIIDELADLMIVAKDSIEDSINRLAAKARAAGMHLVVATQRPSVDVITGVIKSNIPSRIAFKVASYVDSRTILDNNGAEKLLGKGDMLFNPMGSIKPTRIQGGFVSDAEVEGIVDYLKSTAGDFEYNAKIIAEVESTAIIGEKGRKGMAVDNDDDELLREALSIAFEMKQISASYLQRSMKIGYNRAARLIDQMTEKGYISGRDGNNPRTLLITEMPD